MRSEFNESEVAPSNAGNIALIALIAAVGVTATAFMIAKKVRSSSVRAQVGDLVNLCDRAARTLDERLGPSDYALA